MSSFTTPLVVTPEDDGRMWRLVEPFDYVEGDLATGRKIEVPKDFVTDFASIPRVFWDLLPPWGRYGKAAVLHDFLYSTALFERSHCDRIFLEAMEVLDVPLLTRRAIFLGVRVGGWVAWDAHRRGDTAAEKK